MAGSLGPVSSGPSVTIDMQNNVYVSGGAGGGIGLPSGKFTLTVGQLIGDFSKNEEGKPRSDQLRDALSGPSNEQQTMYGVTGKGTLYDGSGQVVANEQIFGFGLGTYYNTGRSTLVTQQLDRNAVLQSMNVDDVIQQLKYTGQYNQNQLDDIRKTLHGVIIPDQTNQSVSQKKDIESSNYMSVNNVLNGGPQNVTAGLSAKTDTPHEFQSAKIDNTAIRVAEMMRKINGAISPKDLDSAYSKADISDLGRGGMALIDITQNLDKQIEQSQNNERMQGRGQRIG